MSECARFCTLLAFGQRMSSGEDVEVESARMALSFPDC